MRPFITMLFTFFSVAVFAQSITVKDLHLLPGSWKGSLTYIDYNSGKPYTMPANIEVVQMEQTDRFLLAFYYPDEPKANDKDTFLISNSGKVFNGGTIKKVERLKEGGIVITTEQNGRDGNDNKKAVLKHIYTIQNTVFISRKEVNFAGSKNWMLRNEYRFSR